MADEIGEMFICLIGFTEGFCSVGCPCHQSLPNDVFQISSINAIRNAFDDLFIYFGQPEAFVPHRLLTN